MWYKFYLSNLSIESQIEWMKRSEPAMNLRRSKDEFDAYLRFISPPDISDKIWSRTVKSDQNVWRKIHLILLKPNML